MKAKIHVTLKTAVLDPQGKAISNALQTLGFKRIGEVRQGKYIEIDLIDLDYQAAFEQVQLMCEQLLVNPIIENYDIAIEE